MKIGIITSPFGPLPPNAIGAVEILWFYLGREFLKHGNEVTFYAKSDKAYKLNDQLKIVPVKGYKRSKSIYIDLIKDFIYSLNSLKKLKPCDILILNTFWSPILIPLFSSKFNKSIYNVARKPKKHFKFYSTIDQFSCVSKAVEEDTKNFITDKNKVATVSNPVNLDYFTFKNRKINKNSTIKIGYHGRVHPEKGLDLLFKAVELLSNSYNLELIIIGTFDVEKGGGGLKYIDYLKDLAPNVNCTFTGSFSSPEKLNQLLQDFDIYVYPSVATGETFGVSPLEAIATGLPVIVSSLPCFKDFIIDGETGLIFDHTIQNASEDLASKIKFLIESDESALKMGKRGWEKSKDFSIGNIAQKYLSNFKKLLNI